METETYILIINLLAVFIFATIGGIKENSKVRDTYNGFATASIFLGFLILPIYLFFLLWEHWIALVKWLVNKKNT